MFSFTSIGQLLEIIIFELFGVKVFAFKSSCVKLVGMKVLSIRNPEAYLVAFGLKDVENRTWSTDYRGTVQIHCSGQQSFVWPDSDWLPDEVKRIVQAAIDDGTPYGELHRYARGYEDMCRHAEAVLGVSEEPGAGFVDVLKRASILPFVNKAVVGQFDLVDIVRDSMSPWAQEGCYHWLVENPVAYDEPEIGVKGKLRLWNR